MKNLLVLLVCLMLLPVLAFAQYTNGSYDEYVIGETTDLRTEGLVDTIIYDHDLLSGMSVSDIDFFGYKFTPCYPCSLLSAQIRAYPTGEPCSLLVYEWPPCSANLIHTQEMTITGGYQTFTYTDLTIPCFLTDAFLLAYDFTPSGSSIYYQTDFGPGNGRGYYSSDGENWSSTGFGNNAILRAVVRYKVPHFDAAVRSIESPDHIFPPGSTVTPVATVINSGIEPISFDVYCTIDTADTQIYSSLRNVPTLLPDSTYQVTFDDWNPVGSDYTYLLKVYTELATDSLVVNDTLTFMTTPYTPITTINSGWTDTPPTIDGTINTSSEWQNAFCLDVSDLNGGYGDPVPAQTIILYVMNDSTSLYLAADYHTIHQNEMNSDFEFYFDDNNDGVWAGDQSEGFYLLWISPSYSDKYYSLPDLWSVSNPSGVYDARVDEFFHLTYECSIALNETIIYQINASAGDTIGFHCFFKSKDAIGNPSIFPMWWPTLMESDDHGKDPQYYGDIVLATSGGSPSIDDPEFGNTIFTETKLENYPNPFRAQTTISYAIKGMLKAELVELRIYNVIGQLVDIIEGKYGKAEWNTDKLTSGVYFYQIKTENYNEVKRMLMIK